MGKRSITQTQNNVEAVKKRRLTNDKSETTQPTAGIITRVELKNFMNHSVLSFDFQPRVNFVTGRNGTGKSALLTGLMVGLGGKASATSRGNQLSGFIKYGKNIAETKVHLLNKGPNAYHPEIYGDKIIVERRIIRNQGGDYKIKTATGKVASTKKTDLTRILDHFTIQVENPVAILNQETSKNFLLSKNPGDVYKFFVKATQLEQMQLGYDTATKEFESTLGTLKAKESALPTMQMELKQAQDKATALESLDKLRTKLENKQCELAWAVVQQKENEYDTMQLKLSKLQQSRPKYENKVIKSEAKVEEEREAKKEIEERIKTMAGDSESLEPRRNEIKKQLQQLKQQTRTNTEQVQQIMRELKRQTADQKRMEDRIRDIQASSQVDRTSQIQERDDKLKRLMGKTKELEQNCANTKAQMNSALHSLSSLREQKQEIASSVGDCERLKRNHQQKIEEFKKSRNNKVLRFGRTMPALIEEIEKYHKAKRFKRKPVGPLGQHITINDMRFVLGAERALGALMSAFYVDNSADKAVMEEIKRKVCQGDRPPIVLSGKFTDRRYDVSKDRAQTDKPTLLDMLEIDNDIVFNCLIDEVSLHNIVMCLDGNEARDMMYRKPPKNTNVCYDGKGDEIKHNPFRVLANRNTRPNFLSANVEEDIRVETQSLREVSKTLSEETTKLEQVTLQIQSNHEKSQKLKTQVQSAEKTLRKLNAEIEELNNQVVEEDTSADVEALISDVNSLTEEIETIKSNLQKARDKYDAGKTTEKEVEGKFADVSDRIRNVNSSIDPLKLELNQAEDNIDRAIAATTHYKKALKDLDDKLAGEEQALKKYLQEQVERDIEQASQMSQRVSSKKSPEILQAEIKKIEGQLSKEEELRGDADEIRALVNSLTEKYHNAKSQLKYCQIFKQEMRAALKLRRTNMLKITVGTCNRAKLYFTTLLHKRNYDGKLNFNHDELKLEISVWPSASQSQAANDLRGLSGGEKSFSTLCFMMSLWESVNCPFRCMDEFDVFMDMVNRRVSITMLVEFASSKIKHQFIFVTPQDTSQIDVNDFVHIFRMPDPKRGEGGDDDRDK